MGIEVKAERVMELLRGVQHPAMKDDIVSLGIVQDVSCGPREVRFVLHLIEPNDPFGGSLLRACKRVLEQEYPGVEVVSSVQEATPLRKEQPPRKGGVGMVKNVVMVASGKGGVGKSTITVNLGVALARKGFRVGILDADVFGPSVPIMLGVEDERPEVRNEDGEDLIVPVDAYGVKMLSMGFFVPAGDAVVWRGPMASSALKQILHMGLWGELDFLLIDMPPGTGDIQLTVVQELSVTGAVVVSTPQKVALADAQKAMSMLSNHDVKVPILGMVENMAWFETEVEPGAKQMLVHADGSTEEVRGERYFIFGRGGAEQLSKELGIPFLGPVPIVMGIREGGDQGCPIASASSKLGNLFDDLADAFLTQVEWRNANLPATRPVGVERH